MPRRKAVAVEAVSEPAELPPVAEVQPPPSTTGINHPLGVGSRVYAKPFPGQQVTIVGSQHFGEELWYNVAFTESACLLMHSSSLSMVPAEAKAEA